MKYRIYADNSIVHEDDFEDVDHRVPYHDDYQTVDIPDVLIEYIVNNN